MLYRSVEIVKLLPPFSIVFLHSLGVLLPLGYAVYHLTSGTLIIGVMSLLAGLVGLISLVLTLLKKEGESLFPIYIIILSIALFLTCYHHGYRGLIFLFPFTASLFYMLRFKPALICCVLFSLVCLFLALNVHDIAVVSRYAFALTISIGFAASYAYIMNVQRLALEKDAYQDYLTGITNRRHFTRWLNSSLSDHKTTYKNIALFYIDIDDFKFINDTYGHAAGDELLKLFSQRIFNLIRQEDLIIASTEIYNFARLAGDEFVLAIVDLDGADSAKKIAQRLLENTALPFELPTANLYINISIGVAFSEEKINADMLLNNADEAMYRAKQSGKNTFYLYDDTISTELVRRKDIEEGIVKALKSNHFELVYMPIYSIQEQSQIVGFEALLRCYEKYFLFSEPEKFISVAEASGLIKDIDQWVVKQAFEHLHQLREDSPIRSLWCGLNISSAELIDSKFSEKIELLLNQYRVDPAQIHLEITETKLLPYEKVIIERLEKLKELGFCLALDDFGTGYTGLSQLLQFPGHYIKIDRSFVAEINSDDDKYRKMIDIIVSIAHTCQLQVIAEGVETEQQLQYLTDLGCQYAQGYYFSKPVSWKELQRNVHNSVD